MQQKDEKVADSHLLILFYLLIFRLKLTFKYGTELTKARNVFMDKAEGSAAHNPIYDSIKERIMQLLYELKD